MSKTQEDTRFEEKRIPIEPGRAPRNRLRDLAKVLTNRSTGRQITVKGGVGWKEICEEILRDGTHPKSLAQVAAGKWKTANGWEVQILD
jgi:hypothetical protein